MVTLASLKETLRRAAVRRSEAARQLDELDRPRRALAEAQAEEAKARQALEAAELEAQSRVIELGQVNEFLAVWEPHASKVVDARAVLEVLEANMQQGTGGMVNSYDVAKVRASLADLLDYLATQRSERTRLEARIKELR